MVRNILGIRQFEKGQEVEPRVLTMGSFCFWEDKVHLSH